MFSGIIEELGIVNSLSRSSQSLVLKVEALKIIDGLKVGDSVAINGTCLTLTAIKKNVMSFDLLAQTAKVTNLGMLRPQDKVNLERSLRVGDRISGHFVTGHIDCLGIIRRKFIKESNLCFEIAIPSLFIKYCVLKGSIAIDGISLTVAAMHSNLVSVYIIPHTLKNTTLNSKVPSNKVNIEFDLLVKKQVS